MVCENDLPSGCSTSPETLTVYKETSQVCTAVEETWLGQAAGSVRNKHELLLAQNNARPGLYTLSFILENLIFYSWKRVTSHRAELYTLLVLYTHNSTDELSSRRVPELYRFKNGPAFCSPWSNTSMEIWPGSSVLNKEQSSPELVSKSNVSNRLLDLKRSPVQKESRILDGSALMQIIARQAWSLSYSSPLNFLRF